MMNHNYLRTTFDDKIGASFQKLDLRVLGPGCPRKFEYPLNLMLPWMHVRPIVPDISMHGCSHTHAHLQ